MHTAKRGPRAAAATPVSRPQKGARIRRTPPAPTPVHRSPRVPSQRTHAGTHRCTRPRLARTHAPGPAARTYPGSRRTHRGPRTAAASCQTWSRPWRPCAGGRQGTRFTSPGQGLAMAPSCSSSQPEKSSQGRTGAGRRSDGRQWRPGTLPSQVPQPLGRGRDTCVSAAAALRPQALLGGPWLASAVRWPDPGALSNRRGVWTRALRMRTSREEEHGLGPSRGAARDPPAPGLAS